MYKLYKQQLFQDITYPSDTQFSLPIKIRNLFNNDIFQIIILSLIVIIVTTNAKPHIALVVAILFIISMQYVSNHDINETFFGNIQSNNLCIKNENCKNDVCIMQEGKSYGLCK